MTGLSITMFMFGVEKNGMETLGLNFEMLIAQNLEQYISDFMEKYEEIIELENPFAE